MDAEKTEQSSDIGVSVDDLINSILEEKGIEAKAEEPIEEKEDNQTDGADDVTADVLSEVEEEAEKEPEEEVLKEEKPDPVQKRIDKLTAQKKAAEEKAESHRSELEQLREELKALKDKVESPEDKPAPSQNDPLGDIVSKEDLSKKLSEVREIKKWARANKNGGFIGDKEYTAEQVDNMLDWADDMITEHIPARLGYIGQLESATQQAQTAYPDLLKKGTEDNKSYQQYLKQFPEIKKFPDYQMVIGDAIAGQKARSQKAVKALSKSPAKAPPAMPKPSSAPKQTTKPASSPTPVGPLSSKNIDAFLLNLVS